MVDTALGFFPPALRNPVGIPGFVSSDSGLLYPTDAAISVLEKSKKLSQLQTGRFFSDWGRISGYNSTGAMEKPDDEVGYSFLRDAYAHSDIDMMIINRRIQQIKMLAKYCTNPSVAPGWRIVHERNDDPDFEITESIRARCAEVEEVLKSPWDVIHPTGFESVIGISTREELTIDRRAMIMAKDTRGRTRKYWLVDGATVLPIVEILYSFMQRNDKSDISMKAGDTWDPYQTDWQKLAERASEDKDFNPKGYDLTHYAWVQEVDSKIESAWTESQISVDTRQASIWINKLPFGQGSLLQQSLSITAAWVNAWQYNQELFRTNIPETIVALFGDYDPNGMEAFKRTVFSEAGPGSWHRTVFLPADPDYKLQVDKLRGNPQELQFLELLKLTLWLKSFVYGMNPKIWGFPETNRRSSLTVGARRGSGEDQYDEYKDIGARVILEGLADWFTNTIVKSWYPDLRFVFDGIIRQDERERVEILEKKLNSYMTLDEARAVDNLDPLPNGVGAYPLPIATVMIKTEADLMTAQAEAEAMGVNTPDTVDIKQERRSPGDIRHQKETDAEAVGKELRHPAHRDGKPGGPGGRPPKDRSEPGAARRERDRAKRDIREKTGTGTPRKNVRDLLGRRLQSETGKTPDPKRAREIAERKRSKS